MNPSDHFLLVGIGGAGGRIANQVAQATGGRLRAVAIDTDFAAVAQLGLCQQLRLGRSRFDGAGAGGNATLARMAADEDSDALRKVFSDAHVAMVVTGLGGGTGSGVTPTVLRVARDLNVRTLVFATLPFAFEGTERRSLANRTCPQLDEGGDVVALCENDDLCVDSRDRSVGEALLGATRTLADGLTLLWRLACSPGYIGLDFATLANLLVCGRGRALFASAAGQGDRRLEAILSDLLDHPRRGLRRHLGNAPALLVGIVGGADVRLKEVGDIMARLQMETGTECDTRLGTVFDEGERHGLSVAVLLFRSWFHEPAGDLPGAETPAAASGTASTTPGTEAVPRQVRMRRPRNASMPLAGDRFRNTSATVYGGEDLDVPTFLRRGLHIDAG